MQLVFFGFGFHFQTYNNKDRAMAETYIETEAVHPNLRAKYDVDVDELEVLAFIHSCRRARPAQIARAIGLSRTNVSLTLGTLGENGLVRMNGVSVDEYTLTFDGVALVRRRMDKS